MTNGSPLNNEPLRSAVVIGASAGAIDALSFILPALSKGFPLSIMVVVHVPPDKRSLLSDLFRAKCHLDVREAEDKEPLVAGTIYFAPPDYHLLVESPQQLALSSEEPVLFSRPSIDVLFESAADIFGTELIGIILTGANTDGALGLKKIHEAGGATVVQRPDQAQCEAMPTAAIQSCPEAEIMSLEEIASFLSRLGETR
jgi:two-component system chemotaxis response regulator CheB